MFSILLNLPTSTELQPGGQPPWHYHLGYTDKHADSLSPLHFQVAQALREQSSPKPWCSLHSWDEVFMSIYGCLFLRYIALHVIPNDSTLVSSVHKHSPSSTVECQGALWETSGALQCSLGASSVASYFGHHACSISCIRQTHELGC